MFVFVASKGIPPVGSGVKDVRMAQYENNKAIVSQYAKQAREAGFKGLFCVVSDPVDALARAAWQASNTDENGNFDDDERSRALTKLAVTANMEMRALGYKPYVAPALSSGAISILLTLRGEWHYGAVYFGGIYMGCRTRYTAVGLETEVLDMPAALFERIRTVTGILGTVRVVGNTLVEFIVLIQTRNQLINAPDACLCFGYCFFLCLCFP